MFTSFYFLLLKFPHISFGIQSALEVVWFLNLLHTYILCSKIPDSSRYCGPIISDSVTRFSCLFLEQFWKWITQVNGSTMQPIFLFLTNFLMVLHNFFLNIIPASPSYLMPLSLYFNNASIYLCMAYHISLPLPVFSVFLFWKANNFLSSLTLVTKLISISLTLSFLLFRISSCLFSHYI